MISLVFFYLCKVLFSGFLQFNGNFVDGQNNSKYRRDCAALSLIVIMAFWIIRRIDGWNVLLCNENGVKKLHPHTLISP